MLSTHSNAHPHTWTHAPNGRACMPSRKYTHCSPSAPTLPSPCNLRPNFYQKWGSRRCSQCLGRVAILRASPPVRKSVRNSAQPVNWATSRAPEHTGLLTHQFVFLRNSRAQPRKRAPNWMRPTAEFLSTSPRDSLSMLSQPALCRICKIRKRVHAKQISLCTHRPYANNLLATPYGFPLLVRVRSGQYHTYLPVCVIAPT